MASGLGYVVVLFRKNQVIATSGEDDVTLDDVTLDDVTLDDVTLDDVSLLV